jgi:phage N-6-adenine-methyltransferase
MTFKKDHLLEKSDEHYTPKWLFDRMNISFDLDVAAPIGGSYVPANRYYTEQDDGLAQQWSGKVWMNPPFSKPSPWVEKFIAHSNGIALLVVSRSMWFRDLWSVANAIAPTPHNFKFERPDGIKKKVSFQTFLFAMGDECVNSLHNLEARVR